MKNTIMIAGLASVLFYGCSNEPSAKIIGTYALERSFEQKNIETEKVVGTATIRDTILITKKQNGYQLENRVWRKNGYDEQGWVRRYSDGPMHTHTCSYDPTDHSLNTELSLYNPMYLDLDKGLLSFTKGGDKNWKKIDE